MIERRCMWDECPTILSIYNKEKYCFLHASRGRVLEEEDRIEKQYQSNKKKQMAYAREFRKKKKCAS